MFTDRCEIPVFGSTCVITPHKMPDEEIRERNTTKVSQAGGGKAPVKKPPPPHIARFMDPDVMNDGDPTEKERKKKVYKPGERLLKRLHKERVAKMKEAAGDDGMRGDVLVI